MIKMRLVLFIATLLSIILLSNLISAGGIENTSIAEYYNYRAYSFNPSTNEIKTIFYVPDSLQFESIDNVSIWEVLPEENGFLYNRKNCSMRTVTSTLPTGEIIISNLTYCDNALWIYNYLNNNSDNIAYSLYDNRFLPKTYENKIVFVFTETNSVWNYTHNINVYDSNTKQITAITDDEFYKYYPKIHKDALTWIQTSQVNVGGIDYIYYYDIKTSEKKKLTFVDDIGEIYRETPIISDDGILWVEARATGSDLYCVNQTMLYFKFGEEQPIYIADKFGCPILGDTYEKFDTYNGRSIWGDYNGTNSRKLYFYDYNTKEKKLVLDYSNTLNYFIQVGLGRNNILWLENRYNESTENSYILFDTSLWSYDVSSGNKEILVTTNISEFKIKDQEVFWIQRIGLRDYKIFSMSLENKNLKQIYSSDKQLYDLELKDSWIVWKESLSLEPCPVDTCDIDGKCLNEQVFGGANNEKLCLKNETSCQKICDNDGDCHTNCTINMVVFLRKPTGEACNYGMECLSFNCEDNKCISKESLWDRFLSWFKNFFGIFTRGSDKCNDLENEEYKQLCYSCEEQNTTEEKDACYISLVLATTETSFCDKISDSNKEKERCYTFVSREGEKVECDKIKSLGEKDNCYLQLILGGKNNDKEFCKRINDSVIKGRCYEYLALNLGYDANICNEIDNNDIKNRCLAKCTKNELLCKNIIDKFISAECYWDLANLKNSPELCENVDNTPDPEIKGGKSLRDMCYVYTRK